MGLELKGSLNLKRFALVKIVLESDQDQEAGKILQDGMVKIGPSETQKGKSKRTLKRGQ